MNPKNLKLASFLRRLGALSIDVALGIAMFFLLYYTLGEMVIAKGMGVEAKVASQKAFILDTGLCERFDDSTQSASYKTFSVGTIDDPGYLDAQDTVWKYYTVFLVNNENAQMCETDVFSGDQRNSAEVKAWCAKRIFHADEPNSYFASTIDEAGETGVTLKDDAVKMLETNPDETLKKLLEVFFLKDGDVLSENCLYAKAIIHFINQPHYLNVGNDIVYIQYIERIPAIAIPTTLIFLVLPFIFRKGRTLGKLLLGMGVVDCDGMHAKWYKILGHYAMLAGFFYLLLVPQVTLAGILLAFALLIDYFVLAGTNSRRSLHERVSQTTTVYLKECRMFDTYEELDRYLEAYAKYEATLV